MIDSFVQNDILNALWTYWVSKHGDSGLPRRRDIDPTEIPRLLPHLQLVDRVEPDHRFRYRLCGTAIAEAYGRELTGHLVEEVIPEQRRAIALQHYRLALEEARPIFARTQYLSRMGAELIASRLILPLADDAGEPHMLLIGQTCEFHSEIAAQLGSATAVDDYVKKIELLMP